MSKNLPPRTVAQNNGQTAAPIIAAEYEDRKAAIRRNPNYQETLAAVKRAFASLEPVQNKYIYLCSRFEGFADALQVTEELWADLLPRITLVTVALDSQVSPAGPNTSLGIQVSVKLSNKQVVTIGILSSATVGQLKERIENKSGVSCEQHSLVYDNEQLGDEETLASYNIRDGAALELVHAIMFLRVKKPVVYLFPPTSLSNIRVDLSLSTAWEFAAIHPATPVLVDPTPGLGQKVAWTVDAKPDGTLYDHKSSREVSYIFWEAQAIPASLPSPCCSRPGTPLGLEANSAFNPSSPVVNSQNSVLLPFNKVTNYIDDALLALGLHTDARTSFITYWLPELQVHSFLAIRFVPQDQYEAAAPLTVTPTPDITTRVFMLFRGIDECELELWENEEAMALKDAEVWKDIVGVNPEKATDAGLFRVLEWGGMEVK